MNKRFDSPLVPPLRGDDQAVIPMPLATGAEEDSECTVLDWCDQCGRGVVRPHVVNGRPYCRGCCPKCAQGEMLPVRSR